MNENYLLANNLLWMSVRVSACSNRVLTAATLAMRFAKAILTEKTFGLFWFQSTN